MVESAVEVTVVEVVEVVWLGGDSIDVDSLGVVEPDSSRSVSPELGAPGAPGSSPKGPGDDEAPSPL